MYYQFFPYIWFLFSSAGITFALACFGSLKPRIPGQLIFFITMLVCAYWSVCNAFELMGTVLSVKLFWANMEYIAHTVLPVCFTLIVSLLTGYWKKVKIRNVAFLLIVPVATSILVWFDSSLGLVRYGFKLIHKNGNTFIENSYGPWFMLHVFYSYCLILYSVILLLWRTSRQQKLYKRQSLFLLIGIIFICVPNILFVAGIRPVGNFDVTPVLFSVSGIFAFWAIFRYHFLKFIPIAREVSFENMSDGIVVTDNGYRIIDMNIYAEKMFNPAGKSILGSDINDFLPASFFSSVIPKNLQQDQAFSTVIYTGITGGSLQNMYFELIWSPLTDRHKNIAGWIYTVRDITDIRIAAKRMQQQQQQIAVSEEQQRIADDLHDNIGQILSFAGIQIQTIQREIEKGNLSLANDYLKKLKEVTDSAYTKIREYVFNLRRPDLQNISFCSFLKDFADHINSELHVPCTLCIPEKLPDFFSSSGVKSHLISLTKEAVNNCIKHSGATRIYIGLKKSLNSYEYYIEDNGKGFPSGFFDQEFRQTSGIRIMKERALLTGGQLHISSYPGKGTRINVIYTIPEGETL